ncbi:alginate O-acetyltransferase AlgX-related protein [Saccharopolyspora griseoalba]|uniref:AlgX/AlgJ SGNH hydrolase-like domain-containing protein n=1 Tax=Saccharopolyspora griseoalba TaxID=1431848 RepID=A0ABW2LJ15_9PSEU
MRSPGLPPVHEAWLPREHPLHRPRHGRRQLVALVCALVFFSAPLSSWLFGARPEPVENRPLAEFPSVTEGFGFFTGLGAWATDHLPFREQAVRAVGAISREVFGEPAPVHGSAHGSPIGAGRPDPDPPLDENLFPPVVEGRGGWLFLGHDVSYRCVPKRGLDEVIAGLRRWRSAVEDSGREFQLIIAPDKSTMYPDRLPADYAGEECSTAERAEFWNRVPRATGAIDMRGPLREAERRGGRPIYHDVDTHWTHEGGIEMARLLAERLRPGSTASWRVTPSRTYPHSADIPELLGQQRTVPIQAYALAPDGGADNTRFRPSDFHEPLRLRSDARPGMNTRPVRMVGDSFSQFASPYLAATNTDIAITHPDNLALDPRSAGRFLAEGEVVAFELSERFVAGGRYPMLDAEVAEQVGEVLAQHPVG